MNDPTVMHLDFGAAKPARRPNETRYTLTDLSEDEIQDLAAGVVPRVVKAMAAGCLAMIDGAADWESRAMCHWLVRWRHQRQRRADTHQAMGELLRRAQLLCIFDQDRDVLQFMEDGLREHREKSPRHFWHCACSVEDV
jgi:hypothetical protein